MQVSTFFRKTSKATLAILLLSATLFSCGDREQMLRQLEQAEQQNRDYVPFTTDSLALSLTDYFDSHGTPNERMRAHYILGCAYRDLGEAPPALECYNDAVECADTTAKDCDFKTLSRVYGQMSYLYHIEQMPEMEMQATNHSVTHAWNAKDTLVALFYESTKYGVYYQQKLYEEILCLTEKLRNAYLSLGNKEEAARTVAVAILVNLERDSLKKAKEYMDIYETGSGWYNNGAISKGKEFYYYEKGLYYIKIAKNDSAEFFLRKLLADNSDTNNKKAAFEGLHLLYKKAGQRDSTIKYLELYSEWNDSSYYKNESEKLQNIQAMFDYNRHKMIAEKKSAEASRAKLTLSLFAISVVFLLLLVAYVHRRIRAKRNKEWARLNTDYQYQIQKYSLLQADVSNREREFMHTIKHKDEELQKIRDDIAKYQEDKARPENWRLSSRITHSRIYNVMCNLAAANMEATSKEWDELSEVMKAEDVDFINKLKNVSPELSLRDFRICCLVRLRFIPSQMYVLLNISPQALTNARVRMLKKVFNKEGGAKEFDLLIRHL